MELRDAEDDVNVSILGGICFNYTPRFEQDICDLSLVFQLEIDTFLKFPQQFRIVTSCWGQIE